MKACVLFLAAVLSASCSRGAIPELTKDDLRVDYLGSPLTLGEPYADVVRTEPLKSWQDIQRQKISGRGSLFVVEKLIYPGLEISLAYEHVEAIQITDSGAKTARGLSVGMAERDVRRLYGEPHEALDGADTTQLLYEFGGDGVLIRSYSIDFETKGRRVDRINMRIDYNEDRLLTLDDMSVLEESSNRSYHVLQRMGEILGDFHEEPEVAVQTHSTAYRFGGIVFYRGAEDDEVYRIVVDGAGGASARGIVVGDERQKVIDTYGVYDELTQIVTDGEEKLNYVFTNYGLELVYGRELNPYIQALHLQFIIEHDKVARIELKYSAMGD